MNEFIVVPTQDRELPSTLDTRHFDRRHLHSFTTSVLEHHFYTTIKMVSIDIPDNYGYVVLTTLVGQVFANGFMGGNVVKARKNLDVPLPNLYATPGVHKHAEEFNRIQRGHQSILEMITSVTAMALVGGLK